MVAPQSAASDSNRARANRRNARRSTGPRSADGKARAARNSIKHGLFCRDLVLPGEDAEAFIRLRRSVVQRLRPQDELELSFVERIAECQWKLMRVTRMESDAIDPPEGAERDELDDCEVDRQHGRSVLREMFAVGDGHAAAGMMKVLAFNAAERALGRYSIHRTRLENSIHRALRELRQLRKEVGVEDVRDLPPSPFLDLREPALITPPPAPPAPTSASSVQPDATACNPVQPDATDSSISQNEATAAKPRASTTSPSGQPEGTPEGSGPDSGGDQMLRSTSA